MISALMLEMCLIFFLLSLTNFPFLCPVGCIYIYLFMNNIIFVIIVIYLYLI